MKKNVMMRVAAMLLVCVLASTCGISGTFAKYITTDEVQDSARVARWGVTVTANGTLFSKSYKDLPVASAEDTSDAITVQVADWNSGTTNVVAPGTKNDTGMTFVLTGTPEVDTEVTVTVTYTDIVLAAGTYADPTTGAADDEFVLADDYYPVVFTLTNGAGVELVTGNLKTISDYLTALSGTYQTNTNLAEIDTNTDGTYTLTWAWAFDGAQTLNGANFTAEQVDQADTFLGNQATLQKISFEIEITVVQVN